MLAEGEPAPDWGLGPSVTHGWAAPLRWGRSAAMVARRTLDQYVAVCLRLLLTSHTQPTSTLSRIKCETYIVIKKCVRSFIEVRIFDLTMFPLIFIYMYMYNVYAYTTYILQFSFFHLGINYTYLVNHLLLVSFSKFSDLLLGLTVISFFPSSILIVLFDFWVRGY